MKTILIIVVLAALVMVAPATLVYGQIQSKFDHYFEKLPGDVNLNDIVSQRYIMITDYMNYDLNGNFINKTRITGECTLLKDGFVRWNNVVTSSSNKLKEPYPEGDKQSYMENFTYHPSADILSDSFFKDLPEANIYMKNLIWDLTMFEVFATYKWDSLRLNNEYRAWDINSKLKLPGVGNFENKDIRITWAGLTKSNDNLCAIIKFLAMNNPFDMNVQNIAIKGRSNYWGDIHVSLANRQIEFADLYEDVLMDVKADTQESGNKVDVIRYIALKKIGE